MKKYFMLLFFVLTSHFAYCNFFFTEEMQVRLMQMTELPMTFANINGIGFVSGEEDDQFRISPQLSLLLTGMSVSIENAGTGTNTTNTAWGIGGSFGLRMIIGGFLSIKPEFSALWVQNDESKINILEFGADAGFIFGKGDPFSYFIDIIRVGIRPGEITDPWIPEMTGPFYFSFYPTFGIRYNF